MLTKQPLFYVLPFVTDFSVFNLVANNIYNA